MTSDKDKTPVAHTLFTLCRRCGMELEHRVMFHNAAGRVERVKCLTCGSEHKYHPDKGPQVRRAAAKARKTVRVENAELARHLEMLAEKLGQDGAVPYSMTGSFKANDVIDHQVFGKGLVIRISDKKMEVAFPGGTRLLACER